MGLDAVELIMGVEEAFDIEIPDEEAPAIRTVGQMYELILRKLTLIEARPCTSSVVFYRTRRALMDLHGVRRRSVAPSTPMDALLPPGRRRAQWYDLSQAAEVRLPELVLPPRIRRLLNSLVLVLLLTCLAAYFTYPVLLSALYCVSSAVLMWMAPRLAAPLADQLPAECGTVGGTVRAALRLTYGIHPRTWRPKGLTPDEVWETLRKVIVEQLAVPPEAVTAEAELVRDLGAD
jgi:acyl carrier protein